MAERWRRDGGAMAARWRSDGGAMAERSAWPACGRRNARAGSIGSDRIGSRIGHEPQVASRQAQMRPKSTRIASHRIGSGSARAICVDVAGDHEIHSAGVE